MNLDFSGLNTFSHTVLCAVAVWSVAYFLGKVVESFKRTK
jgi:hypothetical protein